MTNETSFLRLQARTQRFTLGTPREFRIGRGRVLFLRTADGQDRTHILWSKDLATGEETRLADPAALLGGHEELSAEERARRERSREQGAGIVGYATDAEVTTAAFALSGRLFAVTDTARELDTPGPVIDPRPDPTGRHIAYVADGALRVIGVDGAGDRALAEPEGEDRAWGLAEFIAAEEMNRSRGYWWSPDGTRLLVAHTDRRAVQRWHIADPANPGSAPHTVAYPAAGTTNVTVRLAVIDLDGNRTDVDWDGEYLVTAHWSATGLLIAAQTRDQRTYEVRSVDPATGATEIVHTDTDDTWVEIVTGVPAWTPGGELVRVSADGEANRLFVGDRPVSGELQVRAVLDVGDDILFTASADDPTQVHVYTAGRDGVTRLSTEDGVHTAARGPGGTVITSWSLERAGARHTVSGTGVETAEIANLAVTPPLTPNVALLTVGDRDLRAALLYPTGHVPGSRKLPVLMDPYGGPHAQRVLSTRNAYLTPQWLADQGFAVVVADGRGTPGRGPAWERAVRDDFAGVTLADQVDALHAIAKEHPDLDLDKVAIRGWSYGGYLAALAVLRAPEVFHAAIAGAPVTDWRLYDTHYTERYLGHPDEQPEVYDRNSLIDDAPNLSRQLLIIHGLADDNVVVAHAIRLSSALVAAGRPHALLPLPGVTHMTPQEDDVAENFMLMQMRWLKSALGIDQG